MTALPTNWAVGEIYRAGSLNAQNTEVNKKLEAESQGERIEHGFAVGGSPITTVAFSSAFQATPDVVAVSYNVSDARIAAVTVLNAGSFEFALYGTSAALVAGSIYWMAVGSGNV